MVLLTREQIEARLVALHRASMVLVSDLSLDTVLERIVNLAREQAGARYAALGVLDEHGAPGALHPGWYAAGRYAGDQPQAARAGIAGGNL